MHSQRCILEFQNTQLLQSLQKNRKEWKCTSLLALCKSPLTSPRWFSPKHWSSILVYQVWCHLNPPGTCHVHYFCLSDYIYFAITPFSVINQKWRQWTWIKPHVNAEMYKKLVGFKFNSSPNCTIIYFLEVFYLLD